MGLGDINVVTQLKANQRRADEHAAALLAEQRRTNALLQQLIDIQRAAMILGPAAGR